MAAMENKLDRRVMADSTYYRLMPTAAVGFLKGSFRENTPSDSFRAQADTWLPLPKADIARWQLSGIFKLLY